MLDDIDAAVAPLRLPTSVRRLWERIDPASLAAETYPALATPASALEVWKDHQRTASVPARLFPICHTSWAFVFVELDAPGVDDGGALFEWMYGGADFELTYDDVEDLDRRPAAGPRGGPVRTRARKPALPLDGEGCAGRERAGPPAATRPAPCSRHDYVDA